MISYQDQYFPIQPPYERNISFRSKIVTKENSLSGIVAEYYELNYDGSSPHVGSFIPDACIDITFQYADRNLSSYICGNYSKMIEVHRDPFSLLFGVRFHPGAASAVLGLSAEQLFEQHFYMQSQITQRMSRASGFEDRIRIVEDFFSKKYKTSTECRMLIDYCINYLVNENDSISIHDLAAKTGYSDRYLRKVFQMYIGFSPKTFSEIIQLQKAITLIETSFLSRSDVAFQCGYSDLSHMNRAIRRFASEKNNLRIDICESQEVVLR